MNKFATMLFIVLFTSLIFGQEYTPDEFEFFVVDSYITSESPYTLKVMFFTSDSCLTKIKIENDKEFTINSDYSDEHRTEISISSFNFDSLYLRYQLSAETKSGKIFKSEIYEEDLPEGQLISKKSSGSGFVNLCIGGIIFMLPSPAILLSDSKYFYSLSKEIQLITFYNDGFNYPSSYISLEYSYVFDNNYKSKLRLGYKKIIKNDLIEYISPGFGVYSDFNNVGLSPEISFGLFKIFNVFTLYTRYRFDYLPGNSKLSGHEISTGLYANFFSINF